MTYPYSLAWAIPAWCLASLIFGLIVGRFIYIGQGGRDDE